MNALNQGLAPDPNQECMFYKKCLRLVSKEITAELPPIFFIIKHHFHFLNTKQIIFHVSIHSKNLYNLISSIFTLVFSVYGSNYSYIFQCVALWGVAVWLLAMVFVLLHCHPATEKLCPTPLPFNRDMYSVYHVLYFQRCIVIRQFYISYK